MVISNEISLVTSTIQHRGWGTHTLSALAGFLLDSALCLPVETLLWFALLPFQVIIMPTANFYFVNTILLLDSIPTLPLLTVFYQHFLNCMFPSLPDNHYLPLVHCPLFHPLQYALAPTLASLPPYCYLSPPVWALTSLCTLENLHCFLRLCYRHW